MAGSKEGQIALRRAGYESAGRQRIVKGKQAQVDALVRGVRGIELVDNELGNL
jgi:hypothetical protein